MTGKGDNQFAGSPECRPLLQTGMFLLLFLALSLPVSAETPVREPEVSDNVFRFALSSRMFSEVRIEDAKAVMKVWILTVAGNRHIPVDPEPIIFDSLEEIIRASRNNLVDGFNVTTEECWRLSKEVKLNSVVVGIHNDQITEEYVLLVRRDKGIESIDTLGGRSLKVLENPRMSLAMIWLDSLLLRKGSKPAALYCSGVTSSSKLTQVVLPVFFGQSDACLVTRRGFQTMSELNPQVGAQLHVLASSPEVVPTVFVFRSDYISPFREKILVEMGRLTATPAGQQILTLIQADRVEEQPMSCLTGAFDLLATHQELISAASRGKAGGGNLLKNETKPGKTIGRYP
jgi:phosphonate transport system substrate-binding protein